MHCQPLPQKSAGHSKPAPNICDCKLLYRLLKTEMLLVDNSLSFSARSSSVVRRRRKAVKPCQQYCDRKDIPFILISFQQITIQKLTFTHKQSVPIHRRSENPTWELLPPISVQETMKPWIATACEGCPMPLPIFHLLISPSSWSRPGESMGRLFRLERFLSSFISFDYHFAVPPPPWKQPTSKLVSCTRLLNPLDEKLRIAKHIGCKETTKQTIPKIISMRHVLKHLMIFYCENHAHQNKKKLYVRFCWCMRMFPIEIFSVSRYNIGPDIKKVHWSYPDTAPIFWAY